MDLVDTRQVMLLANKMDLQHLREVRANYIYIVPEYKIISGINLRRILPGKFLQNSIS